MQKITQILFASIVFMIFNALSFAESSSEDIKIVFINYVLLNEEFKDSVGEGKSERGRTYNELRAMDEAYHEEHFLQVLSKAKDHICKSEDASLLMEFYGVLISTTNSASEAPLWTLGDIFLCGPDLVVSTFSKLGYYEQLIIYDALDFGFRNVTYKKEDTLPNYKTLKDKLTSLMPKQSPILNKISLPDGWRILTKGEVKGKWGLTGFRYYYVVNEDFNGDGVTDEARLLARKDKSGLGLFAFLSSRGKYNVVSLATLDDIESLNYMGIASIPPGRYETAFGKGYNGDYDKHEPKEITLKHYGIDFFKSESANSYFYWDDSMKKFKHTWIGD